MKPRYRILEYPMEYDGQTIFSKSRVFKVQQRWWIFWYHIGKKFDNYQAAKNFVAEHIKLLSNNDIKPKIVGQYDDEGKAYE